MIFRPEGSGYIEDRFQRFQFKHFGFGHSCEFFFFFLILQLFKSLV